MKQNMTEQQVANMTVDLLEKAGQKSTKLLIHPKCLAVVALSSPTLAKAAFPDFMNIISSPDDVGTAITTLVNDDAMMASVVFGLGKFVLTRTGGDEYHPDMVAEFYETFKNASGNAKTELVKMVCDTLNTVLDSELQARDPDRDFEEVFAAYEGIVEKLQNVDEDFVYAVYETALMYVIEFSLSLVLTDNTMEGVETARQFSMTFHDLQENMIKEAMVQVSGSVMQATLHRYLPENDYNMLDREVELLFSNSQVH